MHCTTLYCSGHQYHVVGASDWAQAVMWLAGMYETAVRASQCIHTLVSSYHCLHTPPLGFIVHFTVFD